MVRRPSGRAAAQTNQATQTEERQPETRQERRTTANDASRGASAQTRQPAENSDGVAARSSGNEQREQTEARRETLPATQQTRSMATPVNERNAFETYGQQMAQTSIVGTLIKFSKGDWIDGEDNDVEQEILDGVTFNMDQLMVGWIKWMDNKPVEQIMGPVAEGYQPPRRSELGDTDQTQWELDQNGRPRDPWQFSNYVVLKMPGDDVNAEEDLFTFATSSKGGLGAIGRLCQAYGREMRRRPNDYPIVKLGADSYNHETYGRTYVPLLEITGWEPKAYFEGLGGAGGDDAPGEAENEPEPQPEPQRAAAGGRRRR